MSAVKWGDLITVRNKRPKWLKDEQCPVWWTDGITSDVSDVNRLVWEQSGPPLCGIRLPANHPRYLTWLDVQALSGLKPVLAVDPDLLEARDIIAETYGRTRMHDGGIAIGEGPARVEAIAAGKGDEYWEMRCVVAALKSRTPSSS